MLPPQRPSGDGGGGGLAVVDYRSAFAQTGPADLSGVITAEFDPVPVGLLWLVQRVTVACSSSQPTAAGLYVGDPQPANLVDATQAGNLDTADESSPILVDSNVTLTCRWINADPGSVGVVRIQYQLVQRS